ncbi:MAG: hypothetical protein LBH18_04425 [Spirochaetaceae bacterium]|nr:hypothetical protein [Spirochaetaceae bacterium]
MNKRIKLAIALAGSLLFLGCGVPYPVYEPPEHFKMSGRIFGYSELPERWGIEKVIAIKKDGNVLGEAVPVLDEDNMTWSLPVVAEENSIGTFWIEMSDGISDIQYYNNGADERFISGGHYDLDVNKDEINIPIGSYRQLALIGKNVQYPANANYVLIRDIEIIGDWEPISRSGSEPFSGIFNGHDNTISGLKLIEQNNWQYIGLFGYVQGSVSEPAQLKNINLEISGAELQLSAVNEQCFGVLAGFAENTIFDRITVSGPSRGLKIKKTGGGNFYAGGIVGKIKITGDISTITDSAISRSATLFGIEVDADNTGTGYLGGIAGFAEFADTGISVSNCYSTELVALSNNGRAAYAGGILGYYEPLDPSMVTNYSTITKSYVRGEVSAFGNAGTIAAGGITGNGDGLKIEKTCALMVSVSAHNSASQSAFACAGGFSGYNLQEAADSYQLSSITVTSPSIQPITPINYPVDNGSPVNEYPVDKSAITETWFSGSLEWDFSIVWRWDARTGYPKFLWQ